MTNPTPMHQRMITVATFDSTDSADSFRRYLGSHGIHAVVDNERNVQRYWFLSPARHSVHVRVLSDLAGDAKGRLQDWERMTAPAYRAIHCPDCGSSRIEFPQMSRQFILPTLMAHLSIALGMQRRRYYCKDCHESWSDAQEARQIQSARLAQRSAV